MILFRVCAFSSAVALLASPAFGQVGQPVPGLPQTPAPSTQPAPAPPPAPTKNVPDYPDPRTITLGVSYWLTGPGSAPSIFGGSQAPDYSTLTDLGRPHKSEAIEFFFPITRTGELHFEGFRTDGIGNQIAPVNTDIFTTEIPQGTYLATQYKVTSAKLYLDDLLWPHKFPVAKFRVKALYEVEWVNIRAVVDAPILDAQGTITTGSGTRQFVYPVFGAAAEYALAPHVLLRLSAAGFGLPGKADTWDSEASVGFRHGFIEVRGGGKVFYFKTSPNNIEYLRGTLAGAFIDLRFHWNL